MTTGQEPDTQTTVPPDKDLGAMVEAILEQTANVDWATVQFAHLRYRLDIIHDTAERLAVALVQREAVMGEMAAELRATDSALAQAGWSPDSRPRATLRSALAKYEARHV